MASVPQRLIQQRSPGFFSIKGRETIKALTLLVSGLEMAEEIGYFDDRSRRLAERLWPGQLALDVRKRPDFDSRALGGSVTVGRRAPDSAITLNVIRGLGQAVTGTSANLSGGAAPASADEARRQLGDRVDMVIDDGPSALGVASTIVDCVSDSPVVLREGGVSREAIEAALE